MVSKFRMSKGYVRERVVSPSTLKAMGYTRFRTKEQGDHKLIIAAKGPKFKDGRTKIQAILHPKREFPKGVVRMEKLK